MADTLDVNAVNIATATVDANRARVSCAPKLNIKSDGPLDLKIECPMHADPVCIGAAALRLPQVKGQRIVSAVVTRKGKRIGSARGRSIRRVTFDRPTHGTFAVRITMRTSGKGASARKVTVTRRVTGC